MRERTKCPIPSSITVRRMVVRPERMMLGGIYTGFLKDLVKQYVEAPMHG